MNKDYIEECLDKYDIIDYSEYSKDLVTIFIDTFCWYYGNENSNNNTNISDDNIGKLLADSWYMFINGYKSGRIYL